MLRLCKSSLWFLQDSEIFVSMADQKIRENTVAWQYWISFSQSPKSNKGPLNWTLNWTLVTLFFCIKKSRLNTLDFLLHLQLIWYQSQVISFLHCHYCHLPHKKKVAQFNPHRHFISSHKIKVSLLFFFYRSCYVLWFEQFEFLSFGRVKQPKSFCYSPAKVEVLVM